MLEGLSMSAASCRHVSVRRLNSTLLRSCAQSSESSLRVFSNTPKSISVLANESCSARKRQALTAPSRREARPARGASRTRSAHQRLAAANAMTPTEVPPPCAAAKRSGKSCIALKLSRRSMLLSLSAGEEPCVSVQPPCGGPLAELLVPAKAAWTAEAGLARTFRGVSTSVAARFPLQPTSVFCDCDWGCGCCSCWCCCCWRCCRNSRHWRVCHR
mmetsp:Transcript_59662/g.118231  ORF Transcript_59662/g.118231 Transcript_59662/m.118231 type:complete len:216 (-) Transcript_59662:39-686(-)